MATITPRTALLCLCTLTCTSGTTYAAVPAIPFTVTMSEPVTIGSCSGSSCPYIQMNVNGNTSRYAYCPSVTNSATITCTYTATAGDLDLDGIGIASTSLNTNSIAITDQNGNPLTNLAFVAPANMSSVNVNFPSVSFDFIADADGRYTLNGTAYNDLTSFLAGGAANGSFTRASIGTYYDSTGTLQTAATNVPRFDYDPVSHTLKGLLFEEQRTNLVAYSTNLSNAAWNKQQCSASLSGVIAPDNTSTVYKFIENTANANHYMQYPATGAANTAFTGTLFVKAAERSKVQMRLTTASGGAKLEVDLSAGVIETSGVHYGSVFSNVSSSLTPLNNGWYKLRLTATSSEANPKLSIFTRETSTGFDSYAGDGTSGIYVWGAQLEQGMFPTSYIPTSGATATRNQDFLSIPTGTWTSSTQGTLMAQYAIPYLNNSYPGATSLESAGTDSINIFMNDNSSDGKSSETWVGGTQVFSSPVGTYSVGSVSKTALYFDATSARSASDGILGTLDNSVAVPAFTMLRVGGGRGAWFPLDGWVQKVKYYPIKSSDTQLQLLTQ